MSKAHRVQLQIDSNWHEQDLLQTLKSLGIEGPERVVTSKLDIGDLQLTVDGKAFLIIERKRLPDLVASLHDGRWREQRGRLMASSFYPGRVAYLIQGLMCHDADRDRGYMAKHKTAVYSATANLMFRDGIQCVFVPDQASAAEWLAMLISKLERDGTKCFDAAATDHEGELAKQVKSAAVQGRKSANMTPALVYRAQLACVPRISPPMAKAVESAYPSMKALMDELGDKTTRARWKALSNVSMDDSSASSSSSSSSNRKRLGPAAARNLCLHVFGDTEDDLPAGAKSKAKRKAPAQDAAAENSSSSKGRKRPASKGKKKTNKSGVPDSSPVVFMFRDECSSAAAAIAPGQLTLDLQPIAVIADTAMPSE